MTAEWEFLDPGSPLLPPDGPLTDLSNGSGSIPTVAAYIAGGIWDPLDGDGGWTFPGGGEIQIEMDNIIDFEPFKDIWIQITFFGPAPPTVAQIIAFDNEVGGAVTSQLIDHGPGPDPGIHVWEHWRLWPNPDYETIFIQVDPQVSIDQIIVDTQSVPEPATVMLLALGLGFLVRRRRG